MVRILGILVLFHVLAVFSWAQQPHADHRKHFVVKDKSGKDSLTKVQAPPGTTRTQSRQCRRLKEVYGWYPGWSAGTEVSFDLPLLSTLAYFAYVVDPATGLPSSTDGFTTTTVPKSAQDAGGRVELTVGCFGSSGLTTLLNNPKSLNALRDSVCSLVKIKDIDGVCLDFEGLQSSHKDKFNQFVKDMKGALLAIRRDMTLTVTLPAIPNKNTFDIPSLTPQVDRFALMAYDYHYAGSKNTGPVAPLADVQNSIENYLNAGIPKEKLLLGVPYYGYQWPVSAQKGAGSTTSGKGTPQTLGQIGAATVGWQESQLDSIPWWSHSQSQLWAEDSLSMAIRFGLVGKYDLAGIAIWALGYDAGTEVYWNLIKQHFYDCEAENSNKPAGEQEIEYNQGSGLTSAERNDLNWLWMLGGGAVAIVIMIVARRLLK